MSIYQVFIIAMNLMYKQVTKANIDIA